MAPEEVREKVGRVALDRLNKYVTLLGNWRKVTNLISNESYADIWERHILDAVHLQRQQPLAKSWLDIGSGAGLPGAIIAILLADVPNVQIHCVEIDRRKCSFLREVAAQLAIPMKVHNALAEDISASKAQNVEIVTARAFSSINRILKVAHPFLSNGAIVVMPRGRQTGDEVAQLDRDRYRVNVSPNPSPGDGVFVQIELRASHSL
jgi:16S rRNA (guanine527-N7)-methyltransferase